jgi:hypothetical protein
MEAIGGSAGALWSAGCSASSASSRSLVVGVMDPALERREDAFEETRALLGVPTAYAASRRRGAGRHAIFGLRLRQGSLRASMPFGEEFPAHSVSSTSRSELIGEGHLAISWCG